MSGLLTAAACSSQLTSPRMLRYETLQVACGSRLGLTSICASGCRHEHVGGIHGVDEIGWEGRPLLADIHSRHLRIVLEDHPLQRGLQVYFGLHVKHRISKENCKLSPPGYLMETLAALLVSMLAVGEASL